MHECLEVPEVLNIIAEFTAQPGQKSEDDERKDAEEEEDLFEDALSSHSLSKDLLPFSLCCRYFNEAAMRIRWQRVPRLGHILKCFPDEVSTNHRIPTEAEWDRVVLRTQHIKILKCNSSDLGVLHFLNDHKPAAQLFPNLTHLSFNTAQRLDEFVEFLPNLLSPTLQSVKVKSQQGPQLVRLLEIIAQHVPLLPLLSIYSDPGLQPLGGISHRGEQSQLVFPFKFQNLTELYCPNVSLDRTDVFEIGKLPSLEVLAFQFPLTESHTTLPTADLFPALRAWTTVATHIPDMVLSCLKICKMPKLYNVSLHLDNQPGAIRLHELFTQLGKHPSLEVVELTRPRPFVPGGSVGSYTLHDDQEDALVTDAVLQPLYQCQLSFLSVRYCTSGLDDAALAHISNAWPNLSVLQIGTNCPTAYGRVTWDGLLQLAARCRSLEILGVNAQMSSLDFLASLRKPKPTPCPHVKGLAFNYAEYPDPRSAAVLAAGVSAAFPRAKVCPAEKLEALSPHDFAFWHLFLGMVPVFQLARVQEHLVESS